MVIDIKMCRFDNEPWGFRLVGGSDFDFPLTVVKVTEGSIAEEAGLRAGDIIVRVNDTATSPLTHEEVNHIIRHCGNVFYLGVQRENEGSRIEFQQFPLLGVERRTTPDSFLEVGSSCKSPISTAFSEERDYMPESPERSYSVLSENTEIKLVEEEIAAVLSGESEVLKEHNVMGIFPKPGVCMTSDVLRTLNEEAIKTKPEKEKENRRWTTFLQKPNRPIPKSKEQIEAERRAANAYKVKIVKSAPKVERKDSGEKLETKIEPSTELGPVVAEPTHNVNGGNYQTQTDIKTEVTEITEVKEKQEEYLPTPTDSEVPNLEETETIINSVKTDCELEVETETTSEQPNDKTSESSKPLNENDLEKIEESEIVNRKTPTPPVEEKTSKPFKTEEELALERQLADVQRQLIALSSLPSTIQNTLDAVTKQLAELLPAFKLQSTTEPRKLQLEQIYENKEEANFNKTDKEISLKEEIQKQTENYEHTNGIVAPTESDESSFTDKENADDFNDQEVKDFTDETKEQPQQIITDQENEQQNLKKQKRHDVIEELEEHLDRKKNKRSKRKFGPLTPSSERPVVLPGGRRWYRPKDAYNDEFIAEVLSSQSELITGHTLGSNYESPFLSYDSRVNFMKYQKPEKKIDLNRSEVYKVIHHLDRKPVRGIEIRPSLVQAEEDVRNAVHS